ncbi:MAG: hypothetical protein ACE5H9_06530 [Anaerolineae bacterium]
MLVLQIAVLWLAFTLIVLATGWYLLSTIKLRWPDWWRRVVADEAPKFEDL